MGSKDLRQSQGEQNGLRTIDSFWTVRYKSPSQGLDLSVTAVTDHIGHLETRITGTRVLFLFTAKSALHVDVTAVDMEMAFQATTL